MPKPRTKSRPTPTQPRRSAARSRKATKAPASKRAPAKPAKSPPSARTRIGTTRNPRDPVIVAITLALEEEARQEARAVDLTSQPSAWTALARQRGVRTR